MISFIRMDKKNQMKLRAVCSLLSDVNEDLQFRSKIDRLGHY